MADDDRNLMAAALACAALGRGAVEPNPMVGAIIAQDGVELARGWHERFGGPHAEVQAFAAAKAAECDVSGATMYVTLEPCCHQGKTPPCTDAIIDAGIARVVVAMVDPDPNVAGGGVDALRGAGIDVTVGVMESEARDLLAAYIKHRTTGRPWVICKWAQTQDGYLALPQGQGQWISSPASRARVHEIRSGCDGILVGIGTVLADDPMLNNRSGHGPSTSLGTGKQPVRVVLDSQLRTPADCQLVRTARELPVIVATTSDAVTAKPQAARHLEDAGVEILALAPCASGVEMSDLVDALGPRGWTYLLVEGGATVLQSIIDAGLTNEMLVFISSRSVGPGHDNLPRMDCQAASRGFGLDCEQTEGLDGDRLLRFVCAG